MTIIVKKLPTENFTKIDNRIIQNPEISHVAFRVYCFLAHLPNAKYISDGYILKSLGISQATLTRMKRELKERNLILMEQLGPKVWTLYIGTTKVNAHTVKNRWEKDEAESNPEPILKSVK